MKILAFSQFAPPEIGAAPNRIGAHARTWVEMGHEVTIITGVPNSPFGRVYDGYRNGWCQEEKWHGVRIRRMATFPASKTASTPRRAVAALASSVGMLAGGLRTRADVILATAPYFAGFPAVACARVGRIPLVYEMRDPWLQVAATAAGAGWRHALLRALIALERQVMKRSHALVVATTGMVDLLDPVLPDGVPVHVIFNGIADVSAPRAWEDSTGPVTVGYLGNLGSQYDFSTLLELASRNPDRLRVQVVGAGSQEDAIRQDVRSRGLTNFELAPPVPPALLDSVMAKWDATVIPLRSDPIFECYLPAKMFDSLGRGIPVFISGRGDAARFLEECDGGRSVPSGDVGALESVLFSSSDPRESYRELGEKGRCYLVTRMMRKVQARRLLEILFDASRRSTRS